MSLPLRKLIDAEDTWVRPRPLARHRHLTPTDQPHVGNGLVEGRNGRVAATAMRRPVSPATRWIREVSMASAKAIWGGCGQAPRPTKTGPPRPSPRAHALPPPQACATRVAASYLSACTRVPARRSYSVTPSSPPATARHRPQRPRAASAVSTRYPAAAAGGTPPVGRLDPGPASRTASG
jgi:hypothetical protein